MLERMCNPTYTGYAAGTEAMDRGVTPLLAEAFSPDAAQDTEDAAVPMAAATMKADEEAMAAAGTETVEDGVKNE